MIDHVVRLLFVTEWANRMRNAVWSHQLRKLCAEVGELSATFRSDRAGSMPTLSLPLRDLRLHAGFPA